MNCITFCRFEMNTKFNSSGLPISSTNVCKNHTQEFLFSYSTTANATRKILSFPSFVVTDIYVHQTCPLNDDHLILQVACTPPPPPPKESNFLCIVSHIHPLELRLCVRLSNLSLQNHLTPHISYSYHLRIVPKLSILQPLIT